MDKSRSALVIAAISLLVCASCGREDLPASVMVQIREAQERWLVVDSCLYLPEGVLGSDLRAGDDQGRPGKRLLWSAFQKTREAGLDAVVLMIPVPRASPSEESYAQAKEAAVRSIETVRETIEDHGDVLGLALALPDAYSLKKEGKLAVFLGLGDGYALGRDISLVRHFHGIGVRIIALCGGKAGEICDSGAGTDGPGDPGLSPFGRAVVAVCNDLGIVMDLTGCPERAFHDVLAASEAPVIVSERPAAPAEGPARTLDDTLILEVAARAGIVIVLLDPEMADRTQSRVRRKRPSVGAAADRIDRLIRLAGLGRVGIGTGSGRPGVAGGLEAPGRAIALTVELLRKGYSEYDLERTWGGNLMEVFAQVLSVAEERRGCPAGSAVKPQPPPHAGSGRKARSDPQ